MTIGQIFNNDWGSASSFCHFIDPWGIITKTTYGLNMTLDKAGTYEYGESNTFVGSYNAGNTSGIVAKIVNGAEISVTNVGLGASHLIVESGTFTARAVTNLENGVITVAAGSSFVTNGVTNLQNGTFVIDGGTVDLRGLLTSSPAGVIDFANNPNGTLILNGALDTLGMTFPTIKNYTYGNTIEITNILPGCGPLTTSYNATKHILSVVNAHGQTVLQILNFNETSGTTTQPTATYRRNAIVISCFLEGAMIDTPDGQRTVEELRTGDNVIVVDTATGAEATRPLVWAGYKTTTVNPALSDDEANWPVIIRANAIAEGTPAQDLRVTAEHCLFINGAFVPVRMLVNGRSIAYDKSTLHYTYYHVETADHAVIRANGLLTESYLDTGGRTTFRQHGSVFTLGRTAPKSWATDAAAPLEVRRDIVEPIFNAINARSAALPEVESRPALTDEADLHLVTEAGAIIRQARESEGRAIFMIPVGVESVTLVSRSSRPSDTIGPFVDDRRNLGVLIGEMQLFESKDARPIATHLTEDGLNGWHAIESPTMRWTAGNGHLPLGPRQPHSLAILAVQVVAAGPYLADTTAEAANRLTA